MKLILTLKTQIIFVFLLLFANNNLMAQCSSSPTECQPNMVVGHGTDPCLAKVYCSNSGAVESGLINCTTAADTDGCGIDASASAVANIATIQYANASMETTNLFTSGTCNTGNYLQWIVMATPPTVKGTKVQAVGAVDSWWIFHAGSFTTDPNVAGFYPSVLAALSDPARCDNFDNTNLITCSDANQWETWTNPNAVIGADIYNVYYVALFYDAPTNGSLNYKVKECEVENCIPFTTTCPSNVTQGACQTQTAINSAFSTFLDGFAASGEPSQNPIITWELNGASHIGKPTVADAPSACGGSVTVQYKIVDDCNIDFICERTFMVDPDITDPEILDIPDYSLTGCNTPWPAFLSTSWTDNCATDGNINSNAGVDGTTTGCLQTRVYTFNVTDDCNNSDLETTTVSRLYVNNLICDIVVDPTNDCSGLDVTLDAVPDTGCGALPTGYSYGYSWSNGATTPSITVGDGSYSVDISIIDPNGNITTCSTSCYYTVDEDCETSWAKAANSLCFNELGSEGCPNANQLPWGFTTPVEIGTTYNFDIIEGAPGICSNNGSLGDTVGVAVLTWDGSTPVINITTTDGEHYLSEVHVWIGNKPLPKKGKKCKSAPGQLGCTFENINETSFQINGTSSNTCNGNTSGSQIWIAIHAVTCDLICENESYTGGSGINLSKDEETEVEVSKSNDNINTFDYQIFPNPVEDGQLEVLINAVEANNISIRIFNIHGKLIHQSKLQVFKGKNKYSLDVDDFDSGIFFLHINNGDTGINKRFIKVN